MNPQIKQNIDEIVRLLDHVKREAEETRGYIDRADLGSASRNQNDSRDEIQAVVRKWEELNRLLNQR